MHTELHPEQYMRETLYHAITDIRAKAYEFASNNVKIQLSLSEEELIYLYECVAQKNNRFPGEEK